MKLNGVPSYTIGLIHTFAGIYRITIYEGNQLPWEK